MKNAVTPSYNCIRHAFKNNLFKESTCNRRS